MVFVKSIGGGPSDSKNALNDNFPISLSPFFSGASPIADIEKKETKTQVSFFSGFVTCQVEELS